MKIFLACFAFVASTNTCVAQTHNEVWTKYNLYTKVSSKFSASVDINFRQQANYLTNNKNLFKKPLMRSSRLWLFYNLRKNYALVSSFLLAKIFEVKNENGDLTNATETQFDIGFSKKIKNPYFENRNRFLFEKREIYPTNKTSILQCRYRLQNSLTVPLKTFSAINKINLVLQNELFFKTQQSLTRFDQNRTELMLQWHAHPLEYYVGFQKVYQSLTEHSISKNQLLFIFNYAM